MQHAHAINPAQDLVSAEIGPYRPNHAAAPRRQPAEWSYRNFACMNYDSCLDQAVSWKWEGFTCEVCPHREAIRSDWAEQQAADLDPLSSLAAAVLGGRDWEARLAE